MKIKNIQEYRSFYKNQRPVSNELEEHFIGNYYLDKNNNQKKYGWFTIYHGDKDGYGTPEAGIENFLQSFLDMAKDGQAVYEFLQNAVDAGSTHYSMVWGKDEMDGNHYLLVANNGTMFNLDSVRSILNVGSSTKSNDSHTIGKFGIGFKLAHRLVGKDNGLQELINEHSGPILFSWKNYEIDLLANGENIEPVGFKYNSKSDGNFEMADDHPWLFKILITCFPCLPENSLLKELPKMANGKIADVNPFSTAEYEVLSRWVKKYQHILNKDTYNEGALFFIKLGVGKEEELAEVNLKEGVKFAIAILKETANDEEKNNKLLQTVQLNDNDPITYPELEYIKLIISKETEKDSYAYIRFGANYYDELSLKQKRKMADEADIEALFGFRKYKEIGEYFKGAPNLYLYFPLSEEVHNFNYILHSNAFYKGSSRTFLHKGNSKEDGINERLLKVIVEKVEEKLLKLSESTNIADKPLFLHFYASLLTSKKSTNQDRLWIETPYIDPLNERLKKYIPTSHQEGNENFKIVPESSKVFIKKTEIDIDTQVWGLENVNWFYWASNDNFNIILDSAQEKLGIKDYTIFDLLKNEGVENQVNNWINGEEEKIRLVLKELSAITPDKVLVDIIKPQLLQLKLFRFSNGELLSLDEFLEKENEGYFLLHNTLGAIKDILLKVELVTTTIDLDEFVDKYRSFLLQSSSHSGYTELTKLLSRAFDDENLAKLTKDEKIKIFHAVRTFNTDKVNERIRELKLFINNAGRHVAFKSLLAPQPGSWLNPFSITPGEFDEQLKVYLLNDRKELYQNLIYPYWTDILAYITKNAHQIDEIVAEISSLFAESSWSEKSRNLLSDQDLIVFKNNVLESTKLFFKSCLKSLSDEQFGRIQEIAFKFYQVHIPDKFLISHLETEPLSYSSTHFDVQIPKTLVSIDEINNLMLLCSICNLDFFATNTISFDNDQYIIESNSGKKQYYSTKSDVINYIETYYPNQFVLIPDRINIESGKIEMSETTLIEYLIETFKNETLAQELDLIELVLNERSEDKKSLLESLTYVRLDASWEAERQNELYLKLLNEINIEVEYKAELLGVQKQIIIYKDTLEVNIGDVESAQDTIEVKRGDKTIYLSQAQLLNLANAETIKLIQQFHDEALKRQLINHTKADTLFKISKVGISDDLVTRFEKVLQSLNLLTNALPINNSHQLIFVLLSGKYSMADLKKKFAVKCQDEKWYYLTGEKIIYSEQNNIYIKNSYLLHEQYQNLQSVLSLNDLEVFNYGEDENEDDVIATKFLFVKGLNSDILTSDEELPAILDYLYAGWKGLPRTLRDYKKNAEWETVLGINTLHYVLNGSHTESEILPEEILNWCNDDKSKQEFLRDIGVFVNDKFLNPFRQYLLKERESLPEEIDFLKFNDTILLNTLDGLSGDFSSLDDNPVIYDREKDEYRISLIEQIINHLTERDIECPLLVYNDSDTFHLTKQTGSRIYQINNELHNNLELCTDNNLNLIYSGYYILKPELLCIESIAEEIDEFEFEYEFIPSDIREQHNEPFYHTWSKQHNIVLIKEDELSFEIFNNYDDGKDYIGTVVEGDYFIDDTDGEIINIFYKKSIHLDDLLSCLKDDDNSFAKQIKDLISKRDIMLASIYNAYNSANIKDVNSDHLQALQGAFREENLKQERQGFIDKLKDSVQYSHDWFKSYLDYLLTFSKNTTDNINTKTIRFQTIKRQIVNELISNKYFLLCGASSYISDSIEDISDFSLKVTTKFNKVFTPEIEGAQKQGQDLLVYCPKGLGNELADHLDSVLQVEITFTPKIDLLDELRKAFANETNLNPWEDIDSKLPSVHFIYGPPGTGKTTTLCKEIINIKKQKNDAKILFLSPTNKAADVLCKKLIIRDNSSNNIITQLLKELEDNNLLLSAYRVGNPTDPEIEEFDPDIYQRSVDHSLIKFANVLAMTVHRVPYSKVFDEERSNEIKLFKLTNHWDYVIFDEASMINLPYLVFAMMAISKSSPEAKFIIAGDPKQIPPVVDVDDNELEELDMLDLNVYSMMKINSFIEEEQVLRDCDSIENLNIQYRSVKKIGQLFSELSYDDQLEHHRVNEDNLSKELPENFQKIISNNVTFIDIPLSREDSIYKIRKLFGGSSYHVYSSILVAEMIKYFDNQLPENERWSIGLIAPYKAQAVMMNKLITSFGISDKIKIYADTVHGFQGDECDIVFFICNPNNYYYSGHKKSLLSKEYIYNVAISRAKDYLVIIHPFSEIQNNIFINKIENSYHSNFEKLSIRKSSAIERVLFGNNSFIYNNSYITGHDTVNVFGQLEMKYFIKANTNAIDIQLREL